MTDCKSFEEVKQLVKDKTSEYGLAFLDQCIQRPLGPDVLIQVNQSPRDDNIWELQIFVGKLSVFIPYFKIGDEETLNITSPVYKIFSKAKILGASECLFEEAFPLLRAAWRVRLQIDEAVGELAVRIRDKSDEQYKAGDLQYCIEPTGEIRFFGKKQSAPMPPEKAIPEIKEALRSGFPFVTRGYIDTTTILYIYSPKSNTKCPRDDVIAHFERVLSNQQYEYGSASSYRNPQSKFFSGSGWAGTHRCEGTTCNQPKSLDCDLHLTHNGKPTYFVTNSLAGHYLQEHWADVYENEAELKRLNEYLRHVGIEPIV